MHPSMTLLVLALAAAASCAEPSLLANPRFDDTDADGLRGDGWELWGESNFAAYWMCLPHASLFADGLDASGGVAQTVPASPGAEYTFSITSMRIEENFNADLWLAIEFRGADGSVVGEFVSPIDSSEDVGDVRTGDGLGFEATGVAPEGTAAVRAIIAFDDALPADTTRANAYVFAVSITARDIGPGPCPSDMNGDGRATVQDLLAYLNAFRTGCPEEEQR